MTNDISKLSGLWVFCETNGGAVNGAAFELLGEAGRLAEKMNCAVTAVCAGRAPDGDSLKRIGFDGADSLLLVEDAVDWDELRIADELAVLIRKYSPRVLLLGATAFGRSLAPRLAAKLHTGLTADCTHLDVDPETGLLLQTRPAFGGNLMATIVCPNTTPQMATVRPRVFAAPAPDPSRRFEVIREAPSCPASPIEIIERLVRREDINIGDADILVSVGQGIGSAANIALAEKLAEKLGGMLSASRPMIDGGLLPYARQVGQTGKTVSPKLYIALGISGAIQHMAGVAADNIAAVNTDPDAPIFRYARYAVQCDCGTFLREMLARLGEETA